MTPPAVLFDLDGTLTDSAPGIVASVEHALATMGMESPGSEELRRFIGPPIQDSFRREFGLDDETTATLMLAYREYYRERGLFENSLYPGIAGLLDELSSAGVLLAVATSKPTVFAEQVLETFGIAKRFSAVCGADLAGLRAGKAEIVSDALAALALGEVPGAVMVGDREYDVLGAAANGLACIGVAWGYAAPGELARAGAARIVNDADELAQALASSW
jgi:phosphoglycolate phosphatase